MKKISAKFHLDSPKVVTTDKLENDSKKVYCRCWLSKTFPLCDGSHQVRANVAECLESVTSFSAILLGLSYTQKHNEATGDNVGPLIVSSK